MAIIERVAYEPERFGQARDENLLVWRWPSDELTLGSQLVVGESQEALLFKGGHAVDLFGPGTHTLASDNLPLLGKLIALPFGGQTPFPAEVYFINRHAKLDVKWGTPDPFLVRDPEYQVLVPVRAYGQIGLRVHDSRSLVMQLVGSMHDWDHARTQSYFRGAIVMKVKDCVATFVRDQQVSVIDIAHRLNDIAGRAQADLEPEFARFGIDIVNFFIMSISIPDGDPSLAKIQDILASQAEIERLGQNYRIKRTFDTMDTAAANDSGGAGLFLAGGLGAGLAQTLGQGLQPSDNQIARPLADRLADLKALFERNLISKAEYDQKRNDLLGEI